MKWSEHFWSLEYDGWEMLYEKKMFLIKIVAIKKWGKMKKKAKNVSKKFVKVTMKRNDLYNLSNLQSYNVSIISLFLKEAMEETALWRVEVWKYHAAFMATIIHGTTNCDKYKSSKAAYVAGLI